MTESKIAANAITTNHIKSGAVTADKVDVNSLQANVVRTASLDAGKITSGTLSADRIAAGSITSAKLNVGDIQANVVKTASLDASQIKTGTLSAALITADTLRGKEYYAGDNIHGTRLGAVSSGHGVEAVSGNSVVRAYSTGTGGVIEGLDGGRILFRITPEDFVASSEADPSRLVSVTLHTKVAYVQPPRVLNNSWKVMYTTANHDAYSRWNYMGHGYATIKAATDTLAITSVIAGEFNNSFNSENEYAATRIQVGMFESSKWTSAMATSASQSLASNQAPPAFPTSSLYGSVGRAGLDFTDGSPVVARGGYATEMVSVTPGATYYFCWMRRVLLLPRGTMARSNGQYFESRLHNAGFSLLIESV